MLDEHGRALHTKEQGARRRGPQSGLSGRLEPYPVIEHPTASFRAQAEFVQARAHQLAGQIHAEPVFFSLGRIAQDGLVGSAGGSLVPGQFAPVELHHQQRRLTIVGIDQIDQQAAGAATRRRCLERESNRKRMGPTAGPGVGRPGMHVGPVACGFARTEHKQRIGLELGKAFVTIRRQGQLRGVVVRRADLPEQFAPLRRRRFTGPGCVGARSRPHTSCHKQRAEPQQAEHGFMGVCIVDDRCIRPECHQKPASRWSALLIGSARLNRTHGVFLLGTRSPGFLSHSRSAISSAGDHANILPFPGPRIQRPGKVWPVVN